MAHFEALMDGFLSRVKQAAKADLILHRIGKGKSYMVGGRQAQDFLVGKVLEQPKVRRMINLQVKKYGYPIEDLEEGVRSALKNKGTVGTISKGKSYIDGNTLKPPLSARNVVHHEAFHLVPIIGRSESLAHLYGGLKSQKGKLSPREAIKDYKHLWKSRPAVARKELAIGLGAAGVSATGGYYGAKLLKKERGASDSSKQPHTGEIKYGKF